MKGESLSPFDSLAPWEILAFCETPTVRIISAPGGPTQVLQPDNRRAMIFFSWNNMGVALISPAWGTPQGTGIFQFTANVPFVVMTLSSWGPLVCAEWDTYITAPATVSIISFTVTRWPKQGDDNTEFLKYKLPPPRKVRPNQCPGPDGKRGVLDYWNSLVSRLTGSK